jgi:hypothetical protein
VVRPLELLLPLFSCERVSQLQACGVLGALPALVVVVRQARGVVPFSAPSPTAAAAQARAWLAPKRA